MFKYPSLHIFFLFSVFIIFHLNLSSYFNLSNWLNPWNTDMQLHRSNFANYGTQSAENGYFINVYLEIYNISKLFHSIMICNRNITENVFCYNKSNIQLSVHIILHVRLLNLFSR